MTAKPVMMPTVKLVIVLQLENVLPVRMAMLYQVENAQNVAIPTVPSALVLELESATLALLVTI